MSFIDAEISIVRSDRKSISIQVKPNQLIVRTPYYMKDKEIQAFISSKRDWIEKHLSLVAQRQSELDKLQPYSQQELKMIATKAKEIIPKRVEYYANKIGVTYGRITIRCQRTRWGSCSSKGNLNFNCLLSLFSDEVLDSVVVHELCHRKHMNHSATFYEEVEKVLPEYKKYSNWLKENGSMYLSRLPK